jgi:hypothetical protein
MRENCTSSLKRRTEVSAKATGRDSSDPTAMKSGSAAERRDPILPLERSDNPKGEEPVSAVKPYDISKQIVWEVYQRVKATAVLRA